MQRSSLKARILDHAEARLWEQGYRGMRVDELARDVGISKRTLYEQFRTKEEMACEALGRRLNRMQQEIDDIVESRSAAPKQLRDITKLICDVYSKARSPFYRDLETTPSLTELVQASRSQSHAKLDAVIRGGIEQGYFRPKLDPRLARQVLLTAVEGIVRAEALAEGGMSVEQAFQAAYDVVLNGLLICDSR
jgi:AcrR family transcriptional regulator